MSMRRFVLPCLAVAVAAAGAGCRRSEPFASQKPVSVPESFSASGADPAPAQWWLSLQDPELDRLIDLALRDNLDLKRSWDRLAQAEALARKAGAALLPEITAGAGAGRTRTVLDDPAGASGGGALTGGGTSYASRLSLDAAASYELDLWGRVRSARSAAVLDASAGREDLDAAAITLSAEVARTWYRLVQVRAQLDLLAEQEKTNRDQLELVQLRFKQGLATAVDVLQQRGQLESTLGEVPLAKMQEEILGHQLAVLLGRPPKAEAAGAGRELPKLPGLPITGLPSELLQRRPDVRAAFARLRAADERVAAAAADRFPKISLTAGVGTEANRVRSLFDNWLANLAANLLAPVFDAGRRRAEVERSRAAASERLHAYGQSVLLTLKEVEDALAQERRQAEYVASLEKRLDLARRLTGRSRERYANGASDYLPVLIALRAEQNLERSELGARLTLIEYRIALYRALGGGWPMQRPEDENGEEK